jgi:hypothetical protein
MMATPDETTAPLAAALVRAGRAGSSRRIALSNGMASGSLILLMDRRAFLGTLPGGLLAAPLAAAGQQPVRVPTRRTSRASLVSRARVAVIGLAAFGCVTATNPDIPSAIPGWAIVAFLLIGGALYLVVSGILVVVSQRRRGRRLGKILVAVFAGSLCGALWVLLVGTVANAARPGAIMGPTVLGVGVVTALGAAILLSRPDSLSSAVGLSTMTIGFHSLVLPIGVLIAFLVGGAQWSETTSARPTVTAVILGIRLAGYPSTVGLSVGGLLLGLFLVFIGDRVLRGAGRRKTKLRSRFDLSRPG